MEPQSESFVVPPRGRHGLPADFVATHRRERILAATIELVAKRGYRGTSIDHIVRSAQVGHTTFYELFDGKEDCFCAAFDRVVDEARQRIAASVPVSEPWPEQVCAALLALLDLVAAEPFRARIVLSEGHASGGAALLRHEALLDEVALLLRDGRRLRPDADDPPPTLEEATVGGIAWLLNQRVVVGELQNIDELFPELALIVLEPYLGAEQAHSLVAARSGAPTSS